MLNRSNGNSCSTGTACGNRWLFWAEPGCLARRLACVSCISLMRRSIFALGTVFAAIMLVMFGVIFALYYFSCGYEQALTMSCTRRRFLFGMFVTVCLQLLCLVGGIVVLDAAGPRAVSAAFPRHAH